MSNIMKLLVTAVLGLVIASENASAQLLRFHWHAESAPKFKLKPKFKNQPKTEQRRQSKLEVDVTTPLVDSKGVSYETPSTQFVQHEALVIESIPPSFDSVPKSVPHAMVPLTPYEVIESPHRQTERSSKIEAHAKQHVPSLRHHLPQESRAVVHDVSRIPVWKTPYSYGYFGAKDSKHWHRHHGYRDRSLEWQYR